MPIYEYRCSKCGNLFEEWTKHFDSEATEPCPKCGGEASRIISRTTFKLVGSGWFATDNKPASPKEDSDKKDAGSESDKNSDTAASSETSSASSGSNDKK